MKVKIRTRHGWIKAKAIATECPCLVVTPLRMSAEFSPSGRPKFSEEWWVITHKPTGQLIYNNGMRQAEAIGLANALANGIPWERMRNRALRKRYAAAVRQIIARFLGKPQ